MCYGPGWGGLALGVRMVGDLVWENEKESCFICMDFSASGRYFWNTRYGSAGLRINPEDVMFLEGFGLSLVYARFRYQWGISRRGWDSEYPSGYFLAGTYASSQTAAGLDYTYVFGRGRKGISVSAGVRKILGRRNTFHPDLVVGAESRPFVDPEPPLITAFSVKVEL